MRARDDRRRTSDFWNETSADTFYARYMVLKLLLVSLYVCDSVANGSDLLCVLVGDLDIECLLELHDQLNRVQRICAQMSRETCFGTYRRLLTAQLVNEPHDTILRNC